jgi:hypothetical protein
MSTHEWRMSQEEIDKRAIIRALRRDIPNGGKAWGRWYAYLAQQIEDGELLIVKKGHKGK